MIRSYKDRIGESVAAGRAPKGFPSDLVRAAQRKLFMLEQAVELKDLMSPPGNKLHALSKDRAGQYAIRINDQFRICFRWVDGNAEDVEITDYH
ncbi:type II toxin-antitoxin system RelE/ParE family toxin [Mesorhizobium sp. BE184]|uniref:type II toxin-antitoxin system RelE/ParE family toxin n=1 Tax=Mesorhizobium sp. BE184 TaxID=2817714 RepID=UPI0028673D06|nr:type II toxin-antitoxin system RelE/ParE family toxin [Mesorhizobium sp. BE184]MDR7035154.1 proteic killer suppression protein [Mesorhizobium sp. BE184]